MEEEPEDHHLVTNKPNKKPNKKKKKSKLKKKKKLISELEDYSETISDQ